MGLPLLSDRIQQLVTQQGWTDETLLGLLCDFIDEHNLVPDLFVYLQGRTESFDQGPNS